MGAIGITPIAVTITSGASLSGAIPLGDSALVAIAMPAAWDTAAITFQASVDGTTWGELQGISAVVSVTAAAGQVIAIDPAIWRGINMIKVRSGTSGSPVTQSADRALTLVTKRLP
jgi:hypothetical protein